MICILIICKFNKLIDTDDEKNGAFFEEEIHPKLWGLRRWRAAIPRGGEEKKETPQALGLRRWRAAIPRGGAKENQGKTFPCGNRLESEIAFSLKQAWRKG